MECRSNTSKHCVKDDHTIIKEHFNQDNISTKSQNHHILQNETCFKYCLWSKDVITKTGIKQETQDLNVLASDIKSDPENPPTLDVLPFKGDVMDIKVHFNQKEVSFQSQMHHLLHNEMHYVGYDKRSHMDSKLRIKQETRDPINVIQPDPEESGTCLNTTIDIKEEHWWCDGTSTDTHSEEKESNEGKTEKFEGMLPLESQRLPAAAIYHDDNSKTFLDEDENGTFHKPECVVNSSQKASMRQNISSPYCSTTYGSNHFESKKHLSDGSVSVYKCEVCGDCYTCNSSLKTHKLLHIGTKPYKCDICEKCFKSKHHLRRHIFLHSGTKPYKCDVCEKCFAEKSGLQSHTFLHSGKKPHKCDICEMRFLRNSELQRHKVLHLGTKPYKCEICGKCYPHQSSLKAHAYLHSGTKPFKCDMCEKRFTQNSDLQRHILLHLGKKPFKCDTCGKCFRRNSHLQVHTLLHSDTKPHKCDICEKCFIWKHHLQRHKLLHSGTKPHKCEMCERCFTQKSDLQRHVASLKCKTIPV